MELLLSRSNFTGASRCTLEESLRVPATAATRGIFISALMCILYAGTPTTNLLHPLPPVPIFGAFRELSRHPDTAEVTALPSVRRATCVRG